MVESTSSTQWKSGWTRQSVSSVRKRPRGPSSGRGVDRHREGEMEKYKGYLVFFGEHKTWVHADHYTLEIKGGEACAEFTLEKKTVAAFFGKECGVVSLEHQDAK